jgi:hypothetical protein
MFDLLFGALLGSRARILVEAYDKHWVVCVDLGEVKEGVSRSPFPLNPTWCGTANVESANGKLHANARALQREQDPSERPSELEGVPVQKTLQPH